MQCTTCNMEIPDNSEFCPFCGTKFTEEAPQRPSEQSYAAQQPTPAPQPQMPSQAPTQPQTAIPVAQAEPVPAQAPAEPAPQPETVSGEDLLNMMVNKTNVPEEMKAEAFEMQQKAAQLRPAPAPKPSSPAAEMPSQNMMAETMAQITSQTGQMPSFEQMLAYKVLSGEMTFEQMQQMVMMMNGVQAAPAQQPSSPAVNQTPVQQTAQQAPPVQAVPVQQTVPGEAQPEQGDELSPKEAKKLARAEKKKKRRNKNANPEAEELAKDEFYQNTAPDVDDPLPPSPWLRITRIVLLIILIIILVLCAIYYF